MRDSLLSVKVSLLKFTPSLEFCFCAGFSPAKFATFPEFKPSEFFPVPGFSSAQFFASKEFSPSSEAASLCAPAKFRFKIVIFAPLASRCLHASSLISPAPSTTASAPCKEPSLSFAIATATLETEIGFFEISVWLRMRAAHFSASSIALAICAPARAFCIANL